jgi:hypothetical protein
MTKNHSSLALYFIGFALTVFQAKSQEIQRPPATPLVAHDPYFSIWSTTDKLTDSPTKHWTGTAEPLNSIVRIDGKPYRIMGQDPREIPALNQTEMHVSFTHTRFTFQGAGVQIELSFFTPAFLDDLDVLSRPVTYLTWTAHSVDTKPHDVSVFLNASASLATSYDGQPVTYARHQTETASVLSVGTRDQTILNRSGDNLHIDWGYFHIAVPNEAGGKLSITPGAESSFATTGSLPTADDMEPTPSGWRTVPSLAVALPMGTVGQSNVERYVLLSYTEDYGIQFLHTNLRPYWQRDNMPVSNMLDTAERERAELEIKGEKFDHDLEADLIKSTGAEYEWICVLSYRQAIAAHKLVADRNGDPMLFAKENFSNGDISTVDVMYPSAPIFLFFNPKLLEAQVLPVLEYAAMPNHWHFPFAPHDLGQYPLANGQEYGGGEKTEEDQMPVEESGNMIILVDAIARTEGNARLAQRFWPELTQWALYLKQHGLDPETQLTTDDFAGHVAHNANLSIKAIDALEAYADLASLLHHEEEASSYHATARDYAKKWVGMAAEGDHYKLAFNSPNTWSQKYNLIWDKVLGYNLFPAKVRDAEIAYYLTKLNKYGVPLDSRADYTKLDWSIWTASLADKPADFQSIIAPIYRWTNETESRVPLTDWYDTKTGKQVGFQARSVVGGDFIKALSDHSLAEKWRAKALADHTVK